MGMVKVIEGGDPGRDSREEYTEIEKDMMIELMLNYGDFVSFYCLRIIPGCLFPLAG
jgi:hypothetical protein